ncbi:MAG: Ni/Fe hydrogenase subunit alpha [Thermoproteota archaeon]
MTSEERTIKLEYITRVEGHANVYVRVSDKEVEEVRMQVIETPRFFEAMLKGRKIKEAHTIVSRICGICDFSHTLASVETTENALGMQVSEQTKLLRKLVMYGQHIYSHALHLYLLSLPDYLGFPDAIQMASKYPEEVKRGMRLKKVGNEISRIIGGRATMSISIIPGGFSKLPSKEDLEKINSLLKEELEDAKKTLELFASLKPPRLFRETPFAAIDSKKEKYPLILGDSIRTSDGTYFSKEEFEKKYVEQARDYSYAKFGTIDSKAPMVGALARFNVHGEENLASPTKSLLRSLSIPSALTNRYDNNLAQAIEVVDFFYKAQEITEQLLSMGIKEEEPLQLLPREASGVGVVEAPRGILYHRYSFDKEGRIQSANIVTPTAMNVFSLELDIKQLLSENLNLPESKIVELMEKLIRAYDPCYSCSAHFLKLKIERK